MPNNEAYVSRVACCVPHNEAECYVSRETMHELYIQPWVMGHMCGVWDTIVRVNHYCTATLWPRAAGYAYCEAAARILLYTIHMNGVLGQCVVSYM